MNGGGIWRNAGAGRSSLRDARRTRSTRRSRRGRRRHLPCCARHLRAGAVARRAHRCRHGAPARAVALRSAVVPACDVVAVPAGGRWSATVQRPEGRAQVYLDVSGSMNAEMPLIVALLGHVSALDPPAVLGVQHGGRASGDRARRAASRHVRWHEPRLRARAHRGDATRARR